MFGNAQDKIKMFGTEREKIKAFGTLREKEKNSILQRPYYAYGILRAADIAKYFGKKKTTICEFGVATGAGLLNMIDLAEIISTETGIEFRIVGFDTGEGLPDIAGYKDHPEIWSMGDYPMVNKEELMTKIDGRAELIFGDIKDTVNIFVESLDSEAPIGFISVDVDIYTSAKNALKCLLGRPELYNPALNIYFDDITTFFSNQWCGELAAIQEFNNENKCRKIDKDRTLTGNRPDPNQRWFQRMYICHVLDHEFRTKPDPHRRQKLKVGGNLPSNVLL